MYHGMPLIGKIKGMQTFIGGKFGPYMKITGLRKKYEYIKLP